MEQKILRGGRLRLTYVRTVASAALASVWRRPEDAVAVLVAALCAAVCMALRLCGCSGWVGCTP